MFNAPSLHHERVVADGREPERWMLVLHGIFGAGRNWRSVVRELVTARPDWGGILVDIRQHGRSQGFAGPHTLEAAAGDLRRLVAQEGLPVRSILGHSFGGKVATVYAARPEGELESLWVIDTIPGARAPSGSAWGMLGVLERHPGPFPSREAGADAIEAEGFERPVATWMTTNLERDPEGSYRWQLSIADMRSLLEDFFGTDVWGSIERPPDGLEVHVVKARQSSLLDEADCRRVEEAGRTGGRTHLHVLEGGHWLNADNPGELVALLVSGL